MGKCQSNCGEILKANQKNELTLEKNFRNNCQKFKNNQGLLQIKSQNQNSNLSSNHELQNIDTNLQIKIKKNEQDTKNLKENEYQIQKDQKLAIQFIQDFNIYIDKDNITQNNQNKQYIKDTQSNDLLTVKQNSFNDIDIKTDLQDKIMLIKDLPLDKEILKVCTETMSEKCKETYFRLEEFNYQKYSGIEEEKEKDLAYYGPIEINQTGYYIGQFKNKLRHGRGKQIWQNGSQYEGYWKEDMANRRGRLIHVDGEYYEGWWLNNKANGYGKYVDKMGNIYEGYWQDDRQHGNGTENNSDGSLYEGQYMDGLKSGQGLLMFMDQSQYQGQFELNTMHGEGEFRWGDGRVYSGQWRNNMMHGQGVFSWKDGRKYKGEYQNSVKHGYGEYWWPDGTYYKGLWKAGKQHGQAIYKSVSRMVMHGEQSSCQQDTYKDIDKENIVEYLYSKQELKQIKIQNNIQQIQQDMEQESESLKS